MRRVLVLVVLAALLVGCGSSEGTTKVVKQTVLVKETVVVEVEKEVTVVVEKPVTVQVLVTVAAPTAEPASTAMPASENPPGQLRYEGLTLEQDRGGVVIRVNGVILTPIDTWTDWAKARAVDNPMAISMIDSILEGAPMTIALVKIQVENKTDKKVSLYPDQGTLVVGNEQVDAEVFLSDDVGGDYLGGIMKEGDVMFLLERISATDIAKVRYLVDAAHDDKFDRLAEEGYDFEIELD